MAKSWARKREAQLEASIESSGIVSSLVTWGDLAKDYIEHLEAQELLKRTKRTTIQLVLKYPISKPLALIFVMLAKY